MENAIGKTDPIARVPQSSWENLSKKRICFGHQSVGNNIVQGVREAMESNPSIKLNLVDIKEKRIPGIGGVFAHGAVGRNRHPATKMEEFRKIILEGEGKESDIVLLKFCYVDMDENTDVGARFAEYKAFVNGIRERSPRTMIAHVTVPLTTTRPSIVNRIKKFFGARFDCSENIKNNRYNELLLKEYGGKEPVFDLARIESTRADGTRVTCTTGGETYFCLNEDFTDDGGHLNRNGRKFVAADFLAFLAGLPEKKP